MSHEGSNPWHLKRSLQKHRAVLAETSRGTYKSIAWYVVKRRDVTCKVETTTAFVKTQAAFNKTVTAFDKTEATLT